MAMETKTSLQKKTVDKLQELVQVNIDSHDGFNDAASNTEDMTISSLFRELASQRQQHAAELRTLVAANFEEPQKEGSYAAAAAPRVDGLAIGNGRWNEGDARRSRRGEDHIKAKYEEIVKKCGGSAITDVLNRQYRAVKLAPRPCARLRDTYQEA